MEALQLPERAQWNQSSSGGAQRRGGRELHAKTPRSSAEDWATELNFLPHDSTDSEGWASHLNQFFIFFPSERAIKLTRGWMNHWSVIYTELSLQLETSSYSNRICSKCCNLATKAKQTEHGLLKQWLQKGRSGGTFFLSYGLKEWQQSHAAIRSTDETIKPRFTRVSKQRENIQWMPTAQS